jgi:Family of unknown function (DUF6338)
MPTTLVGLVLFIALLAPGLTYISLRRPHRPIERVSALRETSAIATRSLVCDGLALAAFGLLRASFPHATPDVGQLVRHRDVYLKEHYLSVGMWASGLLLGACFLGLLGSRVASTARIKTISRSATFRKIWPLGRVRTEPAWWVMFEGEEVPAGTRIHVGCQIDDGSYLAGYLYSFSPDSDETEDRELTLTGDISFRPPGATSQPQPLGVGGVIVSARHISYLTVSYVERALGRSPAN